MAGQIPSLFQSIIHEGSKSAIQAMASPETIMSGIHITIKLADYCISLKNASEEAFTFGFLINRVRKDVIEAQRLKREKATLFQSVPEQETWIQETIDDAVGALYKIGSLVENARLDSEKGRTMTLQHRFEWVLGQKEKFMTKQIVLATCHQSLLAGINAMMALRDDHASISSISTSDDVAHGVVHEASSRQRKAVLYPPSRRRRHHSLDERLITESSIEYVIKGAFLEPESFVEEWERTLVEYQSEASKSRIEDMSMSSDAGDSQSGFEPTVSPDPSLYSVKSVGSIAFPVWPDPLLQDVKCVEPLVLDSSAIDRDVKKAEVESTDNKVNDQVVKTRVNTAEERQKIMRARFGTG